MTPYISPRLTPAATPKIISTAGSPRSYSVAGSPKASSFNSPTKYKVENRSNISWYSSSQLSSVASSPKSRPNPGDLWILLEVLEVAQRGREGTVVRLGLYRGTNYQ
ncbi:hypothetical protein QQ045_002926 [Rhodiola kirilowii]